MRRSLALALVLLACALFGASSASAASSDLFFSEYVEGTSNNKALEIYNGTGAAVNLATAGYSVQMFFNGSASAGLTINLTGTVADGDVYVLAQSAADAAILAAADQTNGSGWFNGDDAVVLRKGTAVLDVIGQVGVDPGSEWGSGDASTADNTLRRKATITDGDANGADAFDPATDWDGFPTNTFGGLGSHNGVVVSCPASLSVLQGTAGTAAISATDPDGTVTSLTLGSVTPAPGAGSIALTGVTPASSDGGTATGTLSVDANVPVGSYAVEFDAANDDASPQTGSCTTTVSVQQVLRVSDVQGSVSDLADGPTFRSTLAPPTGNGSSSTLYFVRGVITQTTLARTSAGASQNGFFLQDTLARSDGDETTSDGIFVFMGSFTSLIGGYVPRVGDEVIIRAHVSEFFWMTELSGASLEQLVNPMLDVDVVAPAFTADPPDDLTDADRYWERREGMRGRVPAGALVTGARDVFSSTADSEVWLVRGDSAVAQRSDPYARRAFRDAHPLDNEPPLVDDGNGYRILLGPLGVKATAGDNLALLPPARAFDSLDAAVVGGVDFSFDKYRINPSDQPEFSHGVDPSLNAPPTAFDRKGAYSIANFNVENLYDYRDDPFDGCDFTGNAGCPGVSPPFDYVPESLAAYDEHLGALASEVANDLHGPDLLLVQEAEDQDICTVSAGTLQCGATNDADGKPDTLQELALRIAAVGGPAYDAAYDRNGADDRGIVAAFLYRTDRVQLLPVAPGDPVLGSTPGVTYRGAALPYNADVSNPKALNADLPDDVDTSTGVDGSNVFTRAPQVGHFRVWRNGIGLGAWVDLYAVSNHFSSGPDTRIGQRAEQATYLAAIVAALQAADPQARVDAGGDLNVFPRPDDPLVPASDQLAALYGLGLENLFDTLVAQVPASAYTYVFEGQAQTLDHQFVTPRLGDELERARVAHVNADWPAAFTGDGPRGASDHDPLVARYDLPATMAQLQALLDYYVQQGLVDATTADQLRKRLDQATAKLAQGNVAAYRSQLQAFVDQVRDKTPQSVAPDAAAQLIAEAQLLLAA
ncbi:MAG TPA: lamin tail domain-containing protein [Gaiella sp.]|jgi:predicted extracellular nuclease|nr:lamin tail domain-containing protein [Gaiella sp.]